MKSNTVIKIIIPCLIFIAFSFENHAACAQQKPNIVLIVADDHGIDALGCYGNTVIETPNLDALAKNGTRFTNAFGTNASCSPSRSVILTGLHNHQNGMYGLEHSFHHFNSFDDIKSLPVILAGNNYRTARIGKFHIGPEEPYKFDRVLSPGTANDPASMGRNPVEMAEVSNDFIKEVSKKPFFLYFATDDPHRSNVYVPNGEVSFYTYPKPNSFGNRNGGYAGVNERVYKAEDVIVPLYLPDTKECRAELAQYYQSVSRLDQGVGRLITLLKQAGKYENTLIIYLSDNGAAFPAAKTTLYEAGIKLPCIIKAPKQNNVGLIQNGLISWTDVTPTILDYAQVSGVPTNSLGRSFRSLVETEAVAGWDEIYGSHSLHAITMYYPMRMVRNRNYKLIYNIAHTLPFPFALDLQQSSTWISTEKSPYFGLIRKDKFLLRPKFELYDLEKDPLELNNLSSQEMHQEVLNDMIEKLKTFQTKTNDPWMHKWDFE